MGSFHKSIILLQNLAIWVKFKKKSGADCITLEIQSRETFFLWQFWNESAFENSRM